MSKQATGRAVLVTGASSGIGLAIARVLGQEGYAATLVARRREKLELAADELRAAGMDIQAVVANVAVEADIRSAIRAHEERFGRLDVMVNNAGIGIHGAIGHLPTKHVDMQIAVNLRSVIVFYREAIDMLRAAGAEHGNAIVVNTASISGKWGTDHLSVYSATKHGVVGFTQAMNKELQADGIKSCALCPGLVDTPLAADYRQDTTRPESSIPPEAMIRAEDIAEAVRFLVRTSPSCVVPEIMFMRPGDRL